MAREKRIMFNGVPLVSVMKTNGGWQVQMRTSEDSSDWVDVEDGLFPTRQAAEEAAPYLCEF